MSRMFTKKVDGHTINVEVFSSADECAKACKSRKRTNDRFSDIEAEAKEDKRWYGATYEETMELLQHGYQPTVEALRNVFRANVSGTAKRFRFQNNMVGFAPVVPLALMGVPNSMIDMQLKPIKAKVVDVYFDMTCNSGTRSEQIMEASRKILSAVIELERQGYRFNLYSCTGYFDSGSGDMVCVKVKSAEQPLDLKRVSFMMAHTAAFRVLGFDWYGKFPLGTYRSGYGTSAYHSFGDNSKKVRDAYSSLFGKDNIVFFSAQELVRSKDGEKIIKEALNGNSKN